MVDMKSKNEKMREILALAPVIPVLKFEDPETAVNTCRALVAGGLPVAEITLRTPAALDCISAVIREVEGAIVGSGTVLNSDMLKDCVEVGCQFMVSPGATLDLLSAAKKTDTPLLPGVATPSEAMGLMSEGYELMKFFPAEQAGGVSYLRAIAPVLQGVTFCPTGGLSEQNAPDYLALSNVSCVGGSWVAPASAISDGDWDLITALAAKAAKLTT